MPRRLSSAVPLALVWAALIVYASLYPFTGWRPAATDSPIEWLWLPWPSWWNEFDVVANFVGYLPLGALVVVAWVRSGGSLKVALLLAVLGGSMLSLALETTQNFLPRRVPSRADWVLNSGGAAAGALLLAATWRLGWVERWHAARERWLMPRSSGAVALALLWPVGLLVPAAMPLALGGGLASVVETLVGWLDGTALSEYADALLAAVDMSAAPQPAPLRAALTIGIGYLSPCLLALAAARPGWRRLLLPVGAMLVGLAATTLSTALSFGPGHALAWLGDIVPVALVPAFGVAVLACSLPPRVAASVGLVLVSLQIALVSLMPADPFYALSLQQWEQGRFIRFHGVAQWVGWGWPYAVLVYLFSRVAGRSSGSDT